MGLNFDNELNTILMSSLIEGYDYDIFISCRRKTTRV